MSRRKGFVSNLTKVDTIDSYCSINNCTAQSIFSCFYCKNNICLNHRIKFGDIVICGTCGNSKEKCEMIASINYYNKTRFFCCFRSKRVSFI